LLAAALVAGAYAAVPAPEVTAKQIIDSPQFKKASVFIRDDYERFVRELVTLTEIPAPPFKEERRGTAYLDLLRQAGLSDVERDPEGNVMGLRRGDGTGPLLAVVAHLDTVFPEGTPVTVKRDGTRLIAPGVGDDTRGLALVLAVIRAMQAGELRTSSDVLFVGSVGEEGQGNLRGVRHLLGRGKYRDRIKRFLAIDGGDQGAIVRGGVGSRRYRVMFRGPGGHSYGSFGFVNPAYAMGSAMARLSDIPVPSSPRTTYNVGTVSGGTSVNSIPAEVSMEVDIRSESCAELAKVEQAFLTIVKQAADEENRARSTQEGRIVADPAVIGDRPCGETAMNAPMLRTVAAAVEAFGLKPSYRFGSTDSNIPMSLDIPALTIGHGGTGGRAHSPDEWTDVNRGGVERSVQVALAIILAVAGVP
jgi:acetylornithine deacetylase/succinyl-diaminopimelate desuccinylase-like protein